MTKHAVKKLLVAACASLVAFNASAEDARFVLGFGAQAGAPLPHSYSYGKPPLDPAVFKMRVPLVDPQIKRIFVDSELTVEAATLTVTRVHNERAYTSLSDCTAARDVVEKKLAALMTEPFVGRDPVWQHRSADGHTVGGIACRTERYLPYPTLVFDLSATPP
ncbi:MAG: hypothetical protein EXR83_10820 [Gammaproteobacteria bacterium]|nr:hypothetical protein [Gammaproteobacteria bacterium]